MVNQNSNGAETRVKFYNSIKFKLIATFGILFALIFLTMQALQTYGIPVLGYEGRLANRHSETSDKLNLIADLKKDRLLRFFHERKGKVEVIAGNAYLRDKIMEYLDGLAKTPSDVGKDQKGMGLDDSLFRGIRSHLEFIKDTYAEYDHAVLVDAKDASVLVSTLPKNADPGIDYHRYVKSCAGRTGGHVGEIVKAGYDDKAIVNISCGVRDPENKLIAIIVFAVDVNEVVRPILHTGDGLGQTGEALLINKDVRILTSLKHPLKDGRTPKALEYQINAKPAILAARGQDGDIETEDYRGELVLAAYRHLDMNDDLVWGLVVKQDKDELYEGMMEDLYYSSIFAVTMLVLLFLLVALVSERMTGSLLSLKGATSLFSSGDYSVRSKVSGNDEVGVLASHFNKMADTIQENMNAMEERSAVLAKTAADLEVRQKIQNGTLRTTRVLADVGVLGDLLKKGLESVMASAECEAGAVYIMDSNAHQTLMLGETLGVCNPDHMKTSYGVGEGVIGLAALHDAIKVAEDLAEDFPFNITTFLGDVAPKKMIAVPMFLHGEPVGVIALAGMSPLTQVHKDILEAVRPQFATAITNALANDETARMGQEMNSQNDELVAINKELNAQSTELQQTAVELEAQRIQLEEANQLKSEFLSNMSHELRTPLNSVLALSQLMIARGPGSNVLKDVDHLKIIVKSGKHLLNLINDILDLSKIESGRMEMFPEDVYLPNLLEDLNATIHPLASEKQLDFLVAGGEDLTVRTDPDRLKQIVINLLSNAVKFTDSGSVALSVRCNDHKIIFEVKDTGVGIPKEYCKHIFEEFRQLDGSSTRRHEGTGLGLAISHRLACLLGGSITVDSEPDQGSTFTLFVPLTPPTADDGISHVQLPMPTSGGKTILVVDDDAEARRTIATILGEMGYSTIEATGGKDAIQLLKTHEPYAITLDLFMPDMDGLEVLRHLKNDCRTQDIPVIIVSMGDERDAGFALGATGYVTKPIEQETLKRELQKISALTCVRNVLVVDDDPIVRAQVQSWLKNDFEVAMAANGRDALKMIQGKLPDAVILDLMMPEVDGFQVLSELRSNETTRDLPVIVFSSKDLTAAERLRLSRSVEKIVVKAGGDNERLRTQLETALKGIAPKGKSDAGAQDQILIIEDNAIAALQLSTLLEDEGYGVTVARNGREGLDCIQAQVPDAIILDLMMPIMDGFAVLNEVRSTPWTRKLPVLVLTAKELTGDERRRIHYNNVNELVQKGRVDREALLKKVERMLGKEEIAENVPEKTAKPRPPSERKEKLVLLVEDNPENQVTMGAILDEVGVKYICAGDGVEGIKKAAELIPSLILMDIQLPKMNGMDATRAIKANDNLAHIPIIAVTAKAMKGDREEILAAGCDGYLTKPLDSGPTIETIKKLLGID